MATTTTDDDDDDNYIDVDESEDLKMLGFLNAPAGPLKTLEEPPSGTEPESALH